MVEKLWRKTIETLRTFSVKIEKNDVFINVAKSKKCNFQ